MAAISVMLRLGESSMNSGARLTSAAVCTSLRLSSALSWPLRSRWLLTRAREQSSRSPSSMRRHFQADEQHRLVRAALVDRDVLDDVERERRFSHAGPGGQDHQLRIVQSAGQVVVVDEAGFDAAVGVLVLHAGVDAGQRLVQHVADRSRPGCRPSCRGCGTRVPRRGRAFRGRRPSGSLGVLDDVGAGVDQRAEHRLVADDAGVVLGVGGGGHFLAHLQQVGGAADRFVLAGVLELLDQAACGSTGRPSSCMRQDVAKMRPWASS